MNIYADTPITTWVSTNMTVLCHVSKFLDYLNQFCSGKLQSKNKQDSNRQGFKQFFDLIEWSNIQLVALKIFEWINQSGNWVVSFRAANIIFIFMPSFGRFILIPNHMIKLNCTIQKLITDLVTMPFTLIIQNQGGVRAI